MGWRRRIRVYEVGGPSTGAGDRVSARTGRAAHDQGNEAIGNALLRALLKSPQPRQRARAAEFVRARAGGAWALRKRRAPAAPATPGDGLRALPEARTAEEEERRERPAEVAPSLAPAIAEQSGTGRPLDPLARTLVQDAFGRGGDEVRVHTGVATDRLARRVGRRAFAVGPHVFLERSVTHDGDVVLHELGHAVRGSEKPRSVRYWGGTIHRQITRTVAREMIGDEAFIRKLEDASVKMDYRVRRLAKAAVPFTPILGGAAAGAAVGSFLGPIGALVGGLIGAAAGALATPLGLTRFPSEGPEHGEGGEYRMELRPAREINLRVQRERLRQAVEAYNAWKTAGGTARPGLPPDPVFAKLGDALHIAQDRGSHWEGAKGMGHDDPRHKHLLFGWSPDNIEDNPLGYQHALDNTREVLTEFITATEFSPRVLPPVLTPEETGRAMA